MGHSSIQITVDTYGHLIPGADINWIDGLDRKTSTKQNATPAQLEITSTTEIPPEVVDLNGDPGGSRTPNPQIRSLKPATDSKVDQATKSADSGKVLQNPQPRRNKTEQKGED